MSDDYDDIFIYIKDDSEIELKNMLTTVYHMSNEEIDVLGKKGKDFVIRHNGSKIQSQKIVNMFLEMEKA